MFGSSPPLSGPIAIEGFECFIISNNLDSRASPFTVACVPSAQGSAFLYPVYYEDSLPSFSEFGLDIKETDNGNIVYMSTESFEAASSSGLCCSIKNMNWNSANEYFNQLGALYHLNVITCFKSEMFASMQNLKCYEEDLKFLYGIDDEVGDLRSCLIYIFRKLFFALETFGFTTSSNQKDVETLNNINRIINDNEEFYSFGDLGYAIYNYNKNCDLITTMDTSTPKLTHLTGKNYRLLIRSMMLVKKLLYINGYNINKDYSKNLSSYIKKFQKQQKILESGIWDQITLRSLWIESILNTFNSEELLKDIGIQVRKQNYAGDTDKTIIESYDNDQNKELLRQKLNEMISSIPNIQISEIWLENIIDKSTSEISKRCILLKDRIQTIQAKTENTHNIIKMANDINTRCQKFLDDSTSALNSILQSNSEISKKFDLINRSITTQRNINHFLTFSGVLFLVLFVMKVLNIYPFNK